MKTYTICGSMRFAAEMQRIAYELETRRGWNVLQCAYSPDGATPSPAEVQLLSDAHRRKIDLSDGIYVVNPGGYVGESTAAEIAYARRTGKDVVLHCP